MVIRFFILLLLIGSMFVESTLVQFPLVLIFSFFLFFISRDFLFTTLIFILLLIFDAVSSKIFGISAVVFFAAAFVYFQEFLFFDPKNIHFLTAFVFGIALVYSVIVGYRINLVQYISFFGAVGLMLYGFQKSSKAA